MNLISLVNWEPHDHQHVEYDVFVTAFTGEARSYYFARQFEGVCHKKLVISSPDFVEDKDEFSCEDYVFIAPEELGGYLSGIPVVEGEKVNILFDISCMARHVMAESLAILFSSFSDCEVVLRVNYTIAHYSLPPTDINANESIEAVHSYFSGWSYADSKPTSLILGLGYEPFKAEGASEFFEPYDQWVFVPESPVLEYLPMVKKNNEELLSRSDAESKTIYYKVNDPEMTFGQLEQVVSLLAESTNPVLMPFGPKILFFLCLVQSRCHSEVGVWCVTGSHPEDIGSSVASDYSCGLECSFVF
ncbi:hypothetical protein SAMN03159443_05619 [Pseudomonas sp. NFACC15-1]|uniref:hypothetical protein n=1 Tax=unclassified Pseudomonas TaxID=196821 RepID=UPI00088C6CFB|nr:MULTISPECIES: hypothetical protein [unclassified Pseudomonas]SDA96111.1 hypothetical protein SAMN03159443_05619 [Pseudomonas sp. NFACC15-1]SDZ26514.1 hypothetical protein SAMN03159380_05876 [Pseudomonas sp. NFACC14]